MKKHPKLATNAHRETAVIGEAADGYIQVVRMEAGSLAAEQLLLTDFEANWFPLEYPLEKGISRFMAHAETYGATPDARQILTAALETPNAPSLAI